MKHEILNELKFSHAIFLCVVGFDDGGRGHLKMSKQTKMTTRHNTGIPTKKIEERKKKTVHHQPLNESSNSSNNKYSNHKKNQTKLQITSKLLRRSLGCC